MRSSPEEWVLVAAFKRDGNERFAWFYRGKSDESWAKFLQSVSGLRIKKITAASIPLSDHGCFFASAWWSFKKALQSGSYDVDIQSFDMDFEFWYADRCNEWHDVVAALGCTVDQGSECTMTAAPWTTHCRLRMRQPTI